MTDTHRRTLAVLALAALAGVWLAYLLGYWP
jgi:hypothetical protein